MKLPNNNLTDVFPRMAGMQDPKYEHGQTIGQFHCNSPFEVFLCGWTV